MNPEEESATIKGAMVAAIPTIIFVAQLIGWDWSHSQLFEVVQSIGAVIAGVLMTFGLGRKLYVAIKGLHGSSAVDNG